MKIGIMFSSGKDSCQIIDYYMHQGWDVVCLISILPQNASWMFQKPEELILKAQSQAMEIPLITIKSKGEKEKELIEMKTIIAQAKNKYKLDGIAVGALASDYQHERVNRICEELELKCFAPLWHVSQATIMRRLIGHAFDVRMVSVAAMGLDASWVGKKLSLDDLNKLEHMHKKFGLHIAGEGGEFETIVLDAPFFKKRIEIIKENVITDAEHEAHWNIQEIKLINK